MVLTAMQFTDWLTDYQEVCATQAEALQKRNPPTAVVQLTSFCSSYSAGYLCEVYGIITRLAVQALWQVLWMGIDSYLSFAEILQRAAELFMQFLVRLQATLLTSWQQ